jgi:alanyl-tRNA synthetase
MGLERVAKVLQGVDTVYETDCFQPMMHAIQKLSESQSTDLSNEQRRHQRIMVDHIKAATFILADDVAPSNVDQGYVLRKLIRRAIRSARKLKISTSHITPSVANVVIDTYSEPYGKLQKKRASIIDALTHEEEQFKKTLEEGLKHFARVTEKLSGKEIDGQTAFHLYDTYGFPIELTREMAAEEQLTIDENGFKKAFLDHQNKSRAGAEKRFAGGLADHSAETTKLHTATHLLQAALRKVLGEHVYQKGSNVTAERLRFDFPHPTKMTPEEIKKVEDIVNDAIHRDLPVHFHVTTVDGAKKEGAIGVFDDRYAADVKVYVMGDEKNGVISKEICGGPHVARTSMLGSFKIQKEESSSAGIRRIKAIVSGGPTEIDVASEA